MEALRRTMAVFFSVISIAVYAAAADPDPVYDFCVADPKHTHPPGTAPCKDPRHVRAADFVYSGIRHPGNDSATGFAATYVNVPQLAGLNTLGMSAVRADFEAGGVNPPHLHPRGTELAYVVEGTLYSGFVDSENKVFAKVVRKGDLVVFPRGLVHFQMNVGPTPAVVVGVFNGQNPGLEKLPLTLFGSGIKDEVLLKAFKLSRRELRFLKAKFGAKN